MMITAIANRGGKISPDFSQAESFTIVDGQGTDLEVKEVQNQDPAQAASLLASLGAKRVLAADIDDASIKSLEAVGIQVFYGANGTISDGLNLISLGILDSMANGGSGCGGGCGSGGCGGCASEEKSSSGCGSGCNCS